MNQNLGICRETSDLRLKMTFSLKTVPDKNRESRAIMRGWKDIIAMKRSKFTESQIVFALKQAETGVAVAEVCRKMGISEATFYNWKKKYGGPGTGGVRRARAVGGEDRPLEQDAAEPDFGQAKIPGGVETKALSGR